MYFTKCTQDKLTGLKKGSFRSAPNSLVIVNTHSLRDDK